VIVAPSLERLTSDLTTTSLRSLGFPSGVPDQNDGSDPRPDPEPMMAPPARVMPSIDGDLVRSYLRDIGRVPLLSHEQEITLGRQVQELMALEELREELTMRSGGEEPSEAQLAEAAGLAPAQLKRRLQGGRRAKERMVAANLRLVVSVAKKYTKRNMELLDLIQEGTIGLVRGVEKFDPTRGYKFSTYAYWWIRQGITRAIAEKSRTIRLPIHITETLNKLKKAQRELSQELGRTPTVGELAVAAELPEEEVKDLLCRARQPVSLETKVGDGEDTELLDLLAGEGAGPEEMVAGECLRGDLRELLEQLPELQERVLRLRYGMEGEEPMSLTGIARTLGLSRDKTRNLERRALEQIRSRSRELQAYLSA
jgi:RNA polymerase nonessential primary-like sigma factor